MKKNERAATLAEAEKRLRERYPDSVCALKYGDDPWRLLVMSRLSAQCTDARVNEVSGELLREFPTASDMADGDISRIEELIRPCGLFRTKARNIKDASAIVAQRYGGKIPDNMEELLALPGVGRKIANLLLGDVFGKPAIVCDTHCIRICGRLGMYPETMRDATRAETILRSLIDPAKGPDLCHRLVDFGREVCTARSPSCASCPLSDICAHNRSAQKSAARKIRGSTTK